MHTFTRRGGEICPLQFAIVQGYADVMRCGTCHAHIHIDPTIPRRMPFFMLSSRNLPRGFAPM